MRIRARLIAPAYRTANLLFEGSLCSKCEKSARETGPQIARYLIDLNITLNGYFNWKASLRLTLPWCWWRIVLGSYSTRGSSVLLLFTLLIRICCFQYTDISAVSILEFWCLWFSFMKFKTGSLCRWSLTFTDAFEGMRVHEPRFKYYQLILSISYND